MGKLTALRCPGPRSPACTATATASGCASPTPARNRGCCASCCAAGPVRWGSASLFTLGEARDRTLAYPIGYVHVDIAQVGTGEGKLALFVAIDRTMKGATVKRDHYDSHDQLRAHLALFVDAYNHARRLETLRGLTPCGFIIQAWTKEPDRFRLDPSHLIPGPYS